MKIVLIGSDYDWSLERIYRRELSRLGHGVILMPVQNWFYDYYYKSIFHKLLFRLGFSSILVEINRRILTHSEIRNVDLIWVFKGMEVYPETLKKLKQNTRLLINLNPDNPFLFSGTGSGNENILNGLSLYDFHLTYHREVMSKIKEDYKLPCYFIPFGFDDEVISAYELQCVEEINAVCFLGNPDAYRANFLLEILNQEIPVHVYGNHWSKFLSHHLLSIHGPVYGKDYYRTLRQYRVQLNIMRVHNVNTHNMRTFEIPGCGGIMLAPKTYDHKLFFEEHQHAFFYSGITEVNDQIKYILSLDFTEAQKIRDKARERVLQNFTYKVITTKVISYCS